MKWFEKATLRELSYHKHLGKGQPKMIKDGFLLLAQTSGNIALTV